MKRQTLAFAAAFIVCMALGYSAISFHQLTFNPEIWGKEMRGDYCFGWLPISIGISAAIAKTFKPTNDN